MQSELTPQGLQLPRGVQPVAPDDVAIEALLRDLYEVLSFIEGGEPEWERMANLFSPHARVTRVTPEGTDYFDLRGFQEMAKEVMDLGIYTCFYEREIARSVQVFGSLAHVLSAYETKQSEHASEPLSRGVNSIQLILEDGDWKVLSLFWDEEQPKNPLFLDRLFTKGGAR